MWCIPTSLFALLMQGSSRYSEDIDPGEMMRPGRSDALFSARESPAIRHGASKRCVRRWFAVFWDGLRGRETFKQAKPVECGIEFDVVSPNRSRRPRNDLGAGSHPPFSAPTKSFTPQQRIPHRSPTRSVSTA